MIIGKTRMPHILKAFKTKGRLLSPAPRNAPMTTILIANNGSEKETILKHSLAPSMTSWLFVKVEAKNGANTNRMTLINMTRTNDNKVVKYAKRFAISFRSAPILCPTNVVAAPPIP